MTFLIDQVDVNVGGPLAFIIHPPIRLSYFYWRHGLLCALRHTIENPLTNIMIKLKQQYLYTNTRYKIV